MTSSSRSTSTRRRRRGAAVQLLVGVIVVLGLVASILLVFTERIELVRIGLVAALWAAALGALAMTKYRRELAVEGAKVRDLQTVYQLQLEREVAARREYELGVEARVRRDLQPDVDELAALRTELAALRKNLQLLYEGELPVDRPALRADSTRVGELPGAGWNTPQPTYLAGPYDAPVTAETSAVAPTPSIPNHPLGQWPESDQWATHPQQSWRVEPDDDAEGLHTTGLTVAQIMANLRSEGGDTATGHRAHRREWDQ